MASEINKYIELIGNLSGNDMELLKQLQTELSKRQELIMSNPDALEPVISQLDMSRHSLGVLHLLYSVFALLRFHFSLLALVREISFAW